MKSTDTLKAASGASSSISRRNVCRSFAATEAREQTTAYVTFSSQMRPAFINSGFTVPAMASF